MKIRVKIENADSAKSLEKRVNDWLDSEPNIEILHVAQSETGKFPQEWAVTLTIVYRQCETGDAT